MRKISAVSSLVIAGLIILACGYETPFQAGEPVFVGEGDNPVWSADGSMLAFVRAGSLFVASGPEFAAPDLITTEVDEWFHWVGDTGFVWVHESVDEDSVRTAHILYSDMQGQIRTVAADTAVYRQNRFFGFSRLMPAPDGILRWEIRTRPEKHHDTSRIIRQPLIRYRSFTAGRSQAVFAGQPRGNKNEDNTNILMADWDGARARIMFSGAFGFPYPFLAPDQEHLALRNREDEVMVLDTLGIKYASTSRIKGRVWDWSPDSKYILYNSGESHGDPVHDIFAFDWWQKGHIRITNTPEAGEHAPSFSPDGQYISYFITRRYKPGQVYVIPLHPKK